MRFLVRTVTVLVVAAGAACISSDKIPPKGASITVAANPATIPLASGPECVSLLNVTNCGTATVVATVASEMGNPLPGQDVRFSSTAGRLFTGSTTNPVDAASIPLSTDSFGNAIVNLVTSTTATVTAKSGPTSGTLTINTVTGNLNQIVLNVDTTSSGCSGSTTNVTSCNQSICLEADANDASNLGVDGVVILFKVQNNVLNGSTFDGTFVPAQAVTATFGGVKGRAFTKFVPTSTCPAQCSTSQQKTCQGEIIAQTQGGSFQSPPLQLQINIP